MRDTVTKKPRGFGFITLAQPEAADAVCAEQHTIDGRQVGLPKSEDSFALPFTPTTWENC